MIRSLRKAAQSLERNMETAFSTAPASRTAYVNKTLDINGYHIRLGQVFAEGGFSFLHSAAPTSSSGNTCYAVKRLACPDDESRAVAQREIDFLATLPEHPNIVRFYGGTFHDGHAFLMFDLIDGGTLPDVLSRSRKLGPEQMLSILGDAAAAIAHLHAQQPPVAMRDMKLENLLFDRISNCYKLCDFGSVSSFAGRFTTRQEILAAEDSIANCCTSMYRAPELVDLYAKEFICEKVDVWALGCVWHALLFEKLPFDGLSSLQILKGLTDVPEEPQVPEEYVQLLRRMLTTSPAERADAFEVLETVGNLQGKSLKPEMVQAALRLRELRKSDLGGVGHNGGSIDLLQTSLVPLSDEVRGDAGRGNVNALIDLSSPTADKNDQLVQRAQASQVVAKPTNESGWADFESAFGPAQSQPLELEVGGSRNARGMGSVSTSASKAASTSLIDFSGFTMSSTSDRPKEAPATSLVEFSALTTSSASTSDRPKETAATSQPYFSGPAISSTSNRSQEKSRVGQEQRRDSATRSAPDFSDLIDFGG